MLSQQTEIFLPGQHSNFYITYDIIQQLISTTNHVHDDVKYINLISMIKIT